MAANEVGMLAWVQDIPTAAWPVISAIFVAAIPAYFSFKISKSGEALKRGDTAAAQELIRQKDVREREESILEWHKGEVVGLRKQLTETEAERDLWEVRARWWYRRAQDLLDRVVEARHLAMNCSQIIANLISGGVIDDPKFKKLSDDAPKLPDHIENIEDKA